MSTPSLSGASDAVSESVLSAIARLLAIIERLRDPSGCPWDLAQTHASLKPFALEETYELLEAIDAGADAGICEELGDSLLQIALHCQIASERKAFTMETVAQTLCDKLIRRHPHVFGDAHAPDAQTVARNWQAIKRQEKQTDGGEDASGVDESILTGSAARCLP